MALRKTTDISTETLERVFETGIDKQWIKKIMVYGMNKNNYCSAQLTLEIDWKEHNLQIDRGKATVTIDDRKWNDSTAIELEEVIKLFNNYVHEKELITKIQFYYVDGLDREMANKVTGCSSAKPIEWKSSSWSSQIPELSELRVGFYLADE